MTIRIHRPPPRDAREAHRLELLSLARRVQGKATEGIEFLCRLRDEATQLVEAAVAVEREGVHDGHPAGPEFDPVCPFDDAPPDGMASCALCGGWFPSGGGVGPALCPACLPDEREADVLDAYELAAQERTPGVIALAAAPEGLPPAAEEAAELDGHKAYMDSLSRMHAGEGPLGVRAPNQPGGRP